MRSKPCALLAVLLFLSVASASAPAAYITVYGGATVDQATQTGGSTYDPVYAGGSTIVGKGVAIGTIDKWVGAEYTGSRAVRWDASGTAATELGHLGTDTIGIARSGATAVNSAGTAVGGSWKFAAGTYIGTRAIRWNASGSAPVELGNLGTTSSVNYPTTDSLALAINSAGTAVGYARKYTGGSDLGFRAVRWNSSGTAATELGNLGTASNGSADSQAYAVNTAGTAVGYAKKFASGVYLGNRAVRWDASGTAATELASPTDAFDYPESRASAVNSSGTAVGYAWKYTGGIELGARAIRWDGSGTIATELSNLGTNSLGVTESRAVAVNTAGAAVGYATKFTAGGQDIGRRAVRWDPSSAAPIELGNLDTKVDEYTTSQAFGINDAGAAVGYAIKIGGSALNVGDRRAVLWNIDAVAIDLNTLVDPNSGWTLTTAFGISDTNWAAGIGQFDPDGVGPLGAYPRGFLLDVSSVVPEPGGLAILVLAVPASLRRLRRPHP